MPKETENPSESDIIKVGTSLFESRYVERGHEDAHQGPGPELRIKNTFYEFCIPKDAEPLVRLLVAFFEETFHDDMLRLHTVQCGLLVLNLSPIGSA